MTSAIQQAAQNTQLQQARPTDNLKTLLTKNWERTAAVIGNNMKPERLYQMCVSTINHNPELAACSAQSVLSCFMRCSALGLEPSDVDGLGRAYVLPYGNKNMQTGQKEATLIIGYKGMLDLARRSGEIKDISARAVYEKDTFNYGYSVDGDYLNHQPFSGKSRGQLTYVYMLAHFKDGGHYLEVMSREQVNDIMQRSPSSKSSRSPWQSDFEAMAKKTVIRRAFPFLPASVTAQQSVTSDETTPDYTDVFNPVITDSLETVNTETGETLKQEQA